MSNFYPYGKQSIDEKDIEAVINTLKSDFLIIGPKVKEFEDRICDKTGSNYCVAVCNGTAALHIAAISLLNKGEKVLTTPNSFLATSNAIIYADAVPVFVDINEDGNIDLDECEKRIKKDRDIKAIFGVHFSGNPLNQDKLRILKEQYKIKILEDCAHSLGASFKTEENTVVKAGSCKYSDLSILSFHPVKHITCGEGGAITTNSKELYDKMMILRTHGMQKHDFKNENMAFDKFGNVNPWYYEMQNIGFNYRITDFQCALGISQLEKLDNFIERRREIAQYYGKAFENNEYIKPLYKFDKGSAYHLYVIKIDFERINKTRAEVIQELNQKGVGTQVHYIPINKQPYYKNAGYGKENTPVMDKYYSECLSIPMYPALTDNDLSFILKTINEVVNIK
ncbi:MAG: UDP-4-amino-4,6-dideoxy-N-acetyl-beta-L-altrosamine transaminase [Candidatus Muirbacterium halophilum]|nr:UDP-4-amino-4,6-dideoxy-N-acetyl-beta-L-altrosamine transaminase [Candidatus Muirbacterium halophilum]